MLQVNRTLQQPLSIVGMLVGMNVDNICLARMQPVGFLVERRAGNSIV